MCHSLAEDLVCQQNCKSYFLKFCCSILMKFSTNIVGLSGLLKCLIFILNMLYANLSCASVIGSLCSCTTLKNGCCKAQTHNTPLLKKRNKKKKKMKGERILNLNCIRRGILNLKHWVSVFRCNLVD